MLSLKDNHFLEYLVALESNFTRNDKTKVERPKEEKSLRKVQETKNIIIGAIDDPNYLNMGATLLSTIFPP